MKKVIKIIHLVIALAVVAMTTLHFNACSGHSPLDAGEATKADKLTQLTKGKPGSNGGNVAQYPQFTSHTVMYSSFRDYYSGAKFTLTNGSSFRFPSNSFVPPPEIPWGENVAITWLGEKDEVNNELVYTFGPHGSEFKRPAEIWLSWKDLGSAGATLFYIDEDGRRIKQQPEDIDFKAQKFKITIRHFSRYAIGAE